MSATGFRVIGLLYTVAAVVLIIVGHDPAYMIGMLILSQVSFLRADVVEAGTKGGAK